jgi:hypothetical protein
MKKLYYIFVCYINFLFSIKQIKKYTHLSAYRISLALLQAENVIITGLNLPQGNLIFYDSGLIGLRYLVVFLLES